MLRKDKEEAEAIKNAKALEEEKAMYSVRGERWGGPSASHSPPGEACVPARAVSKLRLLSQGRRSRRQRREFREKRLKGRKISPPR